MACPLTASQTKDSGPTPPSPILKPPSRNDACSPLKVWHKCLWPTDLWQSDCPAHALQRASHRKPALSLAKSVGSRTTSKMNATFLSIFIRGKDLFFATGFCAGKGIFSVSWSCVSSFHCLLNFYLPSPTSPLHCSRLISLRYSPLLDICTQPSVWGVGGLAHQRSSLLWFLSYILFALWVLHCFLKAKLEQETCGMVFWLSVCFPGSWNTPLGKASSG